MTTRTQIGSVGRVKIFRECFCALCVKFRGEPPEVALKYFEAKAKARKRRARTAPPKKRDA